MALYLPNILKLKENTPSTDNKGRNKKKINTKRFTRPKKSSTLRIKTLSKPSYKTNSIPPKEPRSPWRNNCSFHTREFTNKFNEGANKPKKLK